MVKQGKFNLNTYETALNAKSPFPENMEYFTKLNKSLFLDGNYHFYQYTGDYFANLYSNLKQAKKHIYMVSYILKQGEMLQELCEILLERANAGVKIYWLIDDFGVTLVNKRKYFSKLLKNGNVEIIFISKVIYPFIHAQNFYRNHQKFYIVDSQIVFSGGCNLSDEYVGLSKKYGDWIDFNYHLTGNAINSYILFFLRSWELWSKKKTNLNLNPLDAFVYKTSENGTSNSLLTFDSPVYDTSYLEYNLLGLITKAKKSIKIVTPYFSVPSSLFNSLKTILFAGIKVEIYFPEYADKKIIWNTSLNMMLKLKKYGLKIYFYKDSFIHSKCGIIDDSIAFFGSSNMDMRSMYAQYELMDIITGEGVKEVAKIIDNYHKNSIDYDQSNTKFEARLVKKIFYEAIRPLV
ncbi:phospholipase D-like domain-containing protein [Mycoplasmopsis iners]|uniref:phospholipase D-like domain-containing protein n=1 Tax=Mycoplasmopsis iners TaxID=76630 RepID=UPI001FE0E67F|nr:phosphatidylserine/phosphatidylglycerophosphate/cardiolipin synthase family protein [Mycoplasmopsis iners]